MTAAIEDQGPSTAALVPQVVTGALVRQVAPNAEIIEAFNDYQRLCRDLLTDDDYQQIGRKPFRKKSAWRKLAVAMSVSTQIVSRDYQRDGNGRIIRAEIVVRAIAPNGRSWEGLGACDLFERCCVQPCAKADWKNHACCKSDCPGTVHFSKPQHDLPATAQTRAANRACADLFGFGEVSAEEIVDRGDHEDREPNDPEQWFHDNGWQSKRDHDAARRAIVERVSKLPEEAKRAIREWRESKGIGSGNLTAAEAEALAEVVGRVENGEAPEPAEGTTGVAEAPADVPPPASEDGASAPAEGASTAADASAPEGEAEPPAGQETATEAPETGNEDERPCPLCLDRTGAVKADCGGCAGTGFRPVFRSTSNDGNPACVLCGSTRAERSDVKGVHRCLDANGCRGRVEKSVGTSSG